MRHTVMSVMALSSVLACIVASGAGAHVHRSSSEGLLAFSPNSAALGVSPKFQSISDRAGRILGRRLPLKCQAFEDTKQVLKFKEAETGVDVVIVGSMHYNPISIFRASKAVETLADDDNLHAVVIESCPTRWKGSQKSMEGSVLMESLLSNEMHAAATRAYKRGKPVLLGDQRIEEITSKGGKMFKETIRDFMSPMDQGWNRLAADIASAFVACFPPEEKQTAVASQGRKVDWTDALDPALLACLPVTFVRYPLAWLVRGPRGFFTFVSFTMVLSALPDVISAAVAASASDPVTTGGGGVDPSLAYGASVTAGAAIAFAELVLVSRLMLVSLLSDRNSILADSIRAACIKSRQEDDGRAVVAVLGLAHVNGVQQLLMNVAPPDTDPPAPAPVAVFEDAKEAE